VFVGALAVSHICTGAGLATDVAKATASAYAAACASVVASCVLVGDSTAKVKALASAQAKAEIWVASYFNALAFGSDCEACTAYASSKGYIEKYVFLDAVAKAGVTVCHPP
jgi:spore coat protein U-like protein